MQLDGSTEPLDGLHPATLAEGESVVCHWPAPGGRGMLTSLRCLLLSHPRPVHRALRWSVDLPEVYRLEVEAVRGLPGVWSGGAAGSGGGALSSGAVDLTLCVIVDSTIVYIGDPNRCGEIQQAIDEARSSRCLSVYGRLVPYRPGAPITSPLVARAGSRDPDEEPAETSADGVPAPAAPEAPLGFLLFIAGEPFEDSVPMAKTPMTTARFVGGASLGVTSAGGHEPADFEPGQIYGPQAEMARMVLDIAQKCGASVRVVDVDRSGADLPLVQKWVATDDPLPILVRTDGARLVGSGSIVPLKVAEFLQGP